MALHNTAKEELCRITKRMSTGLHEIVRTMKCNYCGVYVKGQKWKEINSELKGAKQKVFL